MVPRAEGDIVTARAAHQASLDIITRLAELDPSNALWRGDVAFTRRRLSRLPPDGEALPVQLPSQSPGGTRPRGTRRAGSIHVSYMP